MNNIIAIIQARMNSTRLPNKVMSIINGKPLIWHICNRLSYSRKIHSLILATSNTSDDDLIAKWCEREGHECFRGSENDVLDRFYQTANICTPKYIVRITADCPLIDPDIVDEVIQLCDQKQADYAANTQPPTFPDGLDVEVFTFTALETSWKQARYAYQREHVTSYITENPNLFSMENLTTKPALSHWRLTVDEPEDLEVIQIVYKALYKSGELFTYQEMIDFLFQHIDILKINDKFTRNEKYNIEDK